MHAGLTLAFVLLIQDGPAPPAAPAPSEATPQDSNTPPESVTVEAPRRDPLDVVHCHREPAGVGSILPRRVCSTERQDQARRDHDRAEFARMQDMQGRGQPVRRRRDD
jgi:hypothetical protein